LTAAGSVWERVEEAVRSIREKGDFKPDLGIIMGTGLGSLGEGIDLAFDIGYERLPHFPISTAESHAGRLLFGLLEGKRVVAMQGRFHYYEGYSLDQVTLPVRVMKALGARALCVSNACGGLNPLFANGDIMLISDHINLIGHNPLIGAHDERLGPRYVDMFECYDRELQNLAMDAARELKQPLQRGVYAAVAGPNLETAAEYRFLRILGADVVGMSTVPEVIVARQVGLRVLGFSIITDMGLPDNMRPAHIEEIIGIARTAEPKLKSLLQRCISAMDL
jgi:purine-nucleoside phosphorylase